MVRKNPFLVDSKTETHSDTQNSESQSESGLESIVVDKELSNTYRYYFDDDVPEATRQIFLQAIDVYNQTGIVKLTATEQDDSKTLYVSVSTIKPSVMKIICKN